MLPLLHWQAIAFWNISASGEQRGVWEKWRIFHQCRLVWAFPCGCERWVRVLIQNRRRTRYLCCLCIGVGLSFFGWQIYISSLRRSEWNKFCFFVCMVLLIRTSSLSLCHAQVAMDFDTQIGRKKYTGEMWPGPSVINSWTGFLFCWLGCPLRFYYLLERATGSGKVQSPIFFILAWCNVNGITE